MDMAEQQKEKRMDQNNFEQLKELLWQAIRDGENPKSDLRWHLPEGTPIDCVPCKTLFKVPVTWTNKKEIKLVGKKKTYLL